MTIELSATRGRIRLRMTCLRLGRDLCVTLSGGDREHVGAVALALPETGGPGMLVRPGHREEELAKAIASRLSARLDAAVCVVCGIHVDDLLPAELATILELSHELTGTLLERLEA